MGGAEHYTKEHRGNTSSNISSPLVKKQCIISGAGLALISMAFRFLLSPHNIALCRNDSPYFSQGSKLEDREVVATLRSFRGFKLEPQEVVTTLPTLSLRVARAKTFHTLRCCCCCSSCCCCCCCCCGCCCCECETCSYRVPYLILLFLDLYLYLILFKYGCSAL